MPQVVPVKVAESYRNAMAKDKLVFRTKENAHLYPDPDAPKETAVQPASGTDGSKDNRSHDATTDAPKLRLV